MPWSGGSEPGAFPTLGYQIADLIEAYCAIPDGDHAGDPFILSDGQLNFLIWFYRLLTDAHPAMKPAEAFYFSRGGQMLYPQKWGKSPFGAATVVGEAIGPVRFDGWDANGEPVGRPWATPLIQLAAAGIDQTGNVMRALLPMVSLSTDLSNLIPDIGETRINLPGGGRIEPVTSAARSRLGARITFAVLDETPSWTKQNKGRKLADTLSRNLAGMGGRFLETGNAFNPSEQSVAQDTYEANDPAVYCIMPDAGAGSIRNKSDRARMLRKVYADAPWVSIDRISVEIDTLLERGEIAQAERYFLNRIIPSEDRAFDARRWAELADKGRSIPDNNTIVIGVDGARYADALAVVATDVESGFQFVLGIWERPENAAEDYEHPLDEVDGAIVDAFERFNVWRVYIDPGSQTANISNLMEKWQGRWTDKRVIAWLMSRPKATAYMIRNYISAVVLGDLTHDGDERMARHIANARRSSTNVYDEDGRVMFVLAKEAPHSPLKIDAAAAGALSWEARGDAIASGAELVGRRSAYDERGLFDWNDEGVANAD